MIIYDYKAYFLHKSTTFYDGLLNQNSCFNHQLKFIQLLEGDYNMCKAVMELEQKGADKALMDAIRNLMSNGQKSFEQACKLLGISSEDEARYRKMM